MRESLLRNRSVVPVGSREWFQKLLDGGPQRTIREQLWDTAVQTFKSWLDKRGHEAPGSSVKSPRRLSGKKIREQPWLTAPRWLLNRAFRKMPRGYREVFEMHERLGYTHREIADDFGCSVGTSKSQLHKARRRLRQSLGPAKQRGKSEC